MVCTTINPLQIVISQVVEDGRINIFILKVKVEVAPSLNLSGGECMQHGFLNNAAGCICLPQALANSLPRFPSLFGGESGSGELTR